MRYGTTDRIALLLFLLLLCCVSPLSAQDVEGFWSEINERLAKREYLRVSGQGGASIGYNYFDDGARDVPRNRPAFNYRINGGLNFDLLGIQAPLTIAYSNRNTVYGLPSYSFVGMSPSYRWITLHGGDRSLTFSPYSLSGVNFRGGGLELTPGKFYIGAMHGRLRRARVQDVRSIQTGLETPLRRMGSGLKLGFDSGQGSEIAVSTFSSEDRVEGATDSLLTRPERNLVLAVSGAQTLSKLVSFSFEYARSLLTRDVTAPALENVPGRLRLFGLFDPNITTSAADAYNGTVTLRPKFGTLNIKYERIAPEYRTHGSLFFQNDLENFTTGVAAPLFEGKLNLSANAGFQRNDLRNISATNLNRFIGAANLQYNWSERVSSTLSVSNFTTTNRYRARTLDNPVTDSLVLAQTQFSLDGSTSVLLDAAGTQSLLLSASWQRANLLRNEVVDTTQQSSFAMFLAGYTYQPEDAGSLTATVLIHRNVTPQLSLLTAGPTVAYGRTVLEDRLNLNGMASYTLTFASFADPALPEPSAGGVLQLSLGGGFELGEQQSIDLTTTLLRAADTEARPGYTDVQLSLSYGSRF